MARADHLRVRRGIIKPSAGLNALRLKTFGGLWIENPASRTDGGPRPRSLALLALLAAAGAKGISRDRALGILWPESDPERARHALSQAVYNLRRELRTDVVLSTPDLRLDSRLISSDVEDFRLATAAKDWLKAADLFTGPFLDGFYLADAPEFERWVEEERGALAALRSPRDRGDGQAAHFRKRPRRSPRAAETPDAARPGQRHLRRLLYGSVGGGRAEDRRAHAREGVCRTPPQGVRRRARSVSPAAHGQATTTPSVTRPRRRR